MRTIVYQSYRTTHVPEWIKTCMQTVKTWADLNAFDYQVYDDSFFEYAPEWFRNKANHEICPVTDLARLVVARELLSQKYDRTIWVDADMLIFDPEKFIITTEKDFQFCHEIWLLTDSEGKRRIEHHVNNSITIFCKNNIHLDFFIDACHRIGRTKASIGKLDVGTIFLSRLRNILPFPLLENVGILSPTLMKEIVLNEPIVLVEYVNQLSAPLACVNLCASLSGQNVQGVTASHSLYSGVIEILLSGRGDAINAIRQK